MGVLEDLLACKPIVIQSASAIDNVPIKDRRVPHEKRESTSYSRKQKGKPNPISKRSKNRKRKDKKNREIASTSVPVNDNQVCAESKSRPEKNRRAFACFECEVLTRPQVKKNKHECPKCSKGMRGVRWEFDVALSFMGFGTYKDYLKSDLWNDIRERVFERDGSKCQCCGNDAVTAHHISYNFEVMMGDQDESLMSVCNSCHYNIHYDRNKNRMTLDQSSARVERFKKYGQWEKEGWDGNSEPIRKKRKRKKPDLEKKSKKHKKGRFFAVWNGRDNGVLKGWAACRFSIKGMKSARYEVFETYEQAKEFYDGMC